ncbi:MAG: hypothetical protein J5I81_02335, partial [Nitrococcus mobilis]|nr:hypothetical protein [Nitrococcus mobilis]
MEHVEAVRMTAGPPALLEFDWDMDTGEVRGPGAAEVLAWAAEAREIGYLSDPSGAYTEEDPLTTRAGMAMLLLNMCYRLPPEFVDDVPAPPQDT